MDELKDLVGTVWSTYQGFTVTVKEVIDQNDIVVEFNDNETVRTRLGNLKLGLIMKPTTRGVSFANAAAKYEGMIMPTVSAGTTMKVIKYNNKNDIEVELQDTGYRTSINLNSLRRGSVYNPYFQNKYGGYFGEGPYTKNSHIKLYNTWSKMLIRISEEGQMSNIRNMSYVGVSICEEWRNYQNFAYWFDSYLKTLNPDYYTQYQIDKDILQRGVDHKIYSPQTCCVVPADINSCIIYEQLSRDSKVLESSLPIGVHKIGSKYQINISMGGTGVNGHEYLGSYNTPEEAFAVYKREKEKYIKSLAQKYYSVGALHKEIYDILMTWEVVDIKR